MKSHRINKIIVIYHLGTTNIQTNFCASSSCTVDVETFHWMEKKMDLLVVLHEKSLISIH